MAHRSTVRNLDTVSSLERYLRPLPLVAVLRGITPDEVEAVGIALVENGFGFGE